MKTLKQILEVYSPKSADEKRFVKKHITIKHPDAAGNGDDVFTASNIKTIDRAKEKKGYDAKSAESVYEESEPMVENWVVHKDGKVLKTGIKQHKTAKAHAEKLGAKVNSAEWYHDNVTSKNKPGVAKEETQIDELSKTTLGSYIKKASRDRGMHGIEAGAAGYKSKEQKSSIDKMKQRQAGVVKAVDKMTEEEQIDELSKATLGSYVKKAAASAVSSTTKSQQYGNLAKDAEKRAKDPKLAFAKAGNKAIAVSQTKSAEVNKAKAEKRLSGVSKAVGKMTEEHQDLLADINDQLIEDMLNEVLSKNADAGDYISDFVRSDNPKFAGKSKAKRIKMALGAYYSKQRGE